MIGAPLRKEVVVRSKGSESKDKVIDREEGVDCMQVHVRKHITAKMQLTNARLVDLGCLVVTRHILHPVYLGLDPPRTMDAVVWFFKFSLLPFSDMTHWGRGIMCLPRPESSHDHQ